MAFAVVAWVGSVGELSSGTVATIGGVDGTPGDGEVSGEQEGVVSVAGEWRVGGEGEASDEGVDGSVLSIGDPVESDPERVSERGVAGPSIVVGIEIPSPTAFGRSSSSTGRSAVNLVSFDEVS